MGRSRSATTASAVGIVVLLCFLVFAAPGRAGSLIPTSTVIPNSEVIINFNSTGLDWVYAGPTGPNGFGPGIIEPATYRASEGWRTATAAEWAAKPAWQDFIKPGFLPVVDVQPIASWSDHTKYKFTSEYWNTSYQHVDINDVALGLVTDGVNNYGSGFYDTFYVRNSAALAAAPLPTAALAGFTLLGGFAAKRRSRRDVAAET